MRRLKRIGLGVLVLGAGLSVLYGWALQNLDTSQVARYIVWLDSDVDDWRRFPSRTVAAGPDRVGLVSPTAPDPSVAAVVADGKPLAAFLAANETTAFLVARGETLVYKLYPNGSSREATQTSFSVAKSFDSTSSGWLRTRVCCTLTTRWRRSSPNCWNAIPGTATSRSAISSRCHRGFATPSSISLERRHDDLLRSRPPGEQALAATGIERPPGRRSFHYNNFNPLLVGMVLERSTGMARGGPTSPTRLWQPMGAEADGYLEPRQRRGPGFEKMESGINGRAVDFPQASA